MPAGARTGRTRWLRPSQSVTCPSRSRNAAAGRNDVREGCEVAELERLHDDARRRSAARAARAPRRGSRGAGRRRPGTGRRSRAPAAAPGGCRSRRGPVLGRRCIGAPDRSRPRSRSLGVVEPPAAGQQRGVDAGRERAAVVRRGGSRSANRARRLAATAATAARGGASGQPRAGDHDTAAVRLRAAPRARRRRVSVGVARPAAAPRPPGGTACARPRRAAASRRGCSTKILRAAPRRPCAAAGAGSAPPARRPGPTTRITFARSTSA